MNRQTGFGASIRTSWPWITLSIAAVVALNPIGLEIIHSAFSASEQLARSLGQFLVYCVLGGLAALGAAEFAVRKYLMSRQRRLASGADNG